MTKQPVLIIASVIILILAVIIFSKDTFTKTQLPEDIVSIPTVTNEDEIVTIEEDSNISPENDVLDFVAPLPESLKGVEMTTYKSEFGFEITYPKSWTRDEINFSQRGTDEYVRYLFDIDTDEDSDPFITISISKTDLNEVIKEFPRDIFIEINGNKGVHTDFENGLNSYSFIEGDKYYSINVYSNTIFNKPTYAGLHEDEMNWIISTFKIIE